MKEWMNYVIMYISPSVQDSAQGDRTACIKHQQYGYNIPTFIHYIGNYCAGKGENRLVPKHSFSNKPL